MSSIRGRVVLCSIGKLGSPLKNSPVARSFPVQIWHQDGYQRAGSGLLHGQTELMGKIDVLLPSIKHRRSSQCKSPICITRIDHVGAVAPTWSATLNGCHTPRSLAQQRKSLLKVYPSCIRISPGAAGPGGSIGKAVMFRNTVSTGSHSRAKARNGRQGTCEHCLIGVDPGQRPATQFQKKRIENFVIHFIIQD
jgi:hypothetical protein